MSNPEPDKTPACDCHRCVSERPANGLRGIMYCRMITCPDCGNKRCPKASDHRLHCTNSNEPGQKGSVYA